MQDVNSEITNSLFILTLYLFNSAALRKATLQLKDLKMLSMVEGVDPALIQLIKPLEAVEQVNIDDPTAVMNFLMQPAIAAVLVEMGKPATRQKLEDVKTKFLGKDLIDYSSPFLLEIPVCWPD